MDTDEDVEDDEEVLEIENDEDENGSLGVWFGTLQKRRPPRRGLNEVAGKL